MKYLTLAVFVGIVSADALENALNSLKLKVTNQDDIDREFNDVRRTAHRIHNSRPARNLRSSIKRWAHSKEMANLEKYDDKFWASPAGQRLAAEWRDVGDVLEEHVYHNKRGIHIDNDAMPEIEDELDDVADQYQKLEHSGWAKGYDYHFDKVFNNKEAHAVERRAKAFKRSAPGKALKKEMREFKQTVKENVHVSDVPEHWKKGQQDLKIEISKEGQMAIEKEANDVGVVAKKISTSRPVRNLDSSLKRWKKSEEAQHLKELDRKFLASPEGKRLMMEWKDFGEVLKEHIKKTPNGIHIDNTAWDEIEDEADDVEHQYKKLEGSKWDKAYTAGWKAASTNRQAHSVGRRWEGFKKSEEFGMLAKELKELDMSLKKNVKVSDIPEDWKKGQQDLKISVQNEQDIEDEWNDVEETWDKIEHSRPVRNLDSSFHRWATSPEMQRLKQLDEAFVKSPEGQRLVHEW